MLLLTGLTVLSAFYAITCFHSLLWNTETTPRERLLDLLLTFLCGLLFADSLLRLIAESGPAAGTGLALAVLLWGLAASALRTPDNKKPKQGLDHVRSQACRSR